MSYVDRKLLLKCLRAILRPVARFCLKHSIQLQDLIECLKAELIEDAKQQIEHSGQRITHSRLSVMTGLHRRDVMRLADGEPSLDRSKGVMGKILGQWQTDTRFLTKNKKPRILSAGTQESEFTSLVRSVSQDLNPASVLLELERLGAVSRTSKGVRLDVQSYLPKGDAQQGFQLLGEDIATLVATVNENIFDSPQVLNLHLRTEYDRIRPEAAEQIKLWLNREGHLLHKRAREYLSQFDQDINPDPSFLGTAIKVVLGSFGKVYEEKGK